MRLRKLFVTMLALFMVLMLLPTGIQALSYPTLDFTLDETDPDFPGSSGAGWTWDSDLATLTLDGFSYMKSDGSNTPALQLPEDSTIIIAPDSENEITAADGAGIVTYGSLIIEGSGSLVITSDDNGIRAVGDLTLTGLTTLQITSQSMGMRVGPGKTSTTEAEGNLSITDCGDVMIKSADDGLKVSGNLFINQVDSIEIHTDESVYTWATGMRVGPGDDCGSSGAAGDAVISNVRQMTIVTNERGGSGLRITGNLLMDNIDQVDITSYHTGVRVGPGGPDLTSSPGNIEIIDCTAINITSTGHTGIRATGNLTVDTVAMLNIESDYMGMRIGERHSGSWSQSDAEGYVHIINSEVDIISRRAGIRSNGAIWTYQSAVKVSDRGEELVNYYGLYSTKGGITIERSHVDVAAYEFALVTGDVCGNYYEDDIGGDIVIIQSFVKAAVDAENGIAAIFAGDNLEPDADGHSRIILEKAFISVPEEAYIVDVEFERYTEFRCQSITSDPEIEIIVSLEQALNYVEIEPYYVLNYDPNGGTGDMTYNEGPYTSGSTITLLESDFYKVGYLFIGWNTLADGSGTMYLPGQEIPLYDDLTLYAQYEPIMFTVIYDANSGEGELIDENSPYMTGSTVTVLENSFTKEEFVFISWNTSADGSGTSYMAGETFIIESDVVLYAQYDAAIPETGDTASTVKPILLLLILAAFSLYFFNKKQVHS